MKMLAWAWCYNTKVVDDGIVFLPTAGLQAAGFVSISSLMMHEIELIGFLLFFSPRDIATWWLRCWLRARSAVWFFIARVDISISSQFQGWIFQLWNTRQPFWNHPLQLLSVGRNHLHLCAWCYWCIDVCRLGISLVSTSDAFDVDGAT